MVDGQRLLTLTEDELKSMDFDITSLGRRKNIMRAINYLKAKVCRDMNNGASMIMKSMQENEYDTNRSAGSAHLVNRSDLGMASMDRSAILSSAQNFFRSKGQDAMFSRNRVQLIDESFDNSMMMQQHPLAHLNKAKSFFDGNMSYIH